MNAWPALQTILHGGWVMRLSSSHTKRANSVNAIDPATQFESLRAAAERLYASHHLPTIFRLSPLADPAIDQALEQAGYTKSDPSLVLHTALTTTQTTPDIEITPTPSAEWLTGSAEANNIPPHLRPIHDRMVTAIALPAAFAIIRAPGRAPGRAPDRTNNRAIGFGLAVHERGAVGLFDIIINPPDRGHGHGRRIANALLHWGHQAGAHTAYLQVTEANRIATALYQSLGFEAAYHYRIRHP
jgi:ribosomal protein S18 acetylase RimI-like enzyme